MVSEEKFLKLVKAVELLAYVLSIFPMRSTTEMKIDEALKLLKDIQKSKDI